MTTADEADKKARLDRAREAGLFRYSLVQELLEPGLPAAGRGWRARELAGRVREGPGGRRVTVSYSTLGRWRRRYEEGGFDALVPSPRAARAADPGGGPRPGGGPEAGEAGPDCGAGPPDPAAAGRVGAVGADPAAAAVRTLLGWYRAGLDVEALLPRLSTYPGHREPRFTYRYLTAAPELLGHAAARLDACQEVTR